MLFENYGYCYCCDNSTKFIATNDWFRDFYTCEKCGCIPRERALSYCIEKQEPNWRSIRVHETSPCNRGASVKLKNNCSDYIESQYFKGVTPGKLHNNMRCEDLESLSFADNSIDLHISQDVMEHVFNPDKAFKEIARTLKPGGKHIFTVPIVNKFNPTVVTATIDKHSIVKHLMEPEYHGNPVSDEGALVTRRWGYDICDFIYKSSGMVTQIIYIDALELGIRAEFIEVLVSFKLSHSCLSQ